MHCVHKSSSRGINEQYFHDTLPLTYFYR